ncbi:MAG: MGMT family protein [Planctomycetaceae bacterium]|nr:MGMT family protein [Planctomycetaceae bacterium]
MPLADPGEEDAEVVVDLGDRPDGAPGVPPAGLLLDRDRGAEPVKPVDLGLGHLAEELAGVAREALDVAPLPLGIECVEGQRALPRARDAGKTDQRAAREFERDVAEVVLAGASDHDVRRGHPWGILGELRILEPEPIRAKTVILYTCQWTLSIPTFPVQATGCGRAADGATEASLPVGVDLDVALGGLASGGALGMGTGLGLGVHGLAPTACDWWSRCPQNQPWTPSEPSLVPFSRFPGVLPGNACSTNNLALAIPCHRVLHRDGTLSGGYHWGDARQRVLLDREAAAVSEGCPTLGAQGK